MKARKELWWVRLELETNIWLLPFGGDVGLDLSIADTDDYMREQFWAIQEDLAHAVEERVSMLKEIVADFVRRGFIFVIRCLLDTTSCRNCHGSLHDILECDEWGDEEEKGCQHE